MNKLNHVAFIMDGNGRWGTKKKRNRNFGHLAGIKTVQKIVEVSIKLKIPTVTFYVFSTENWKRPKSEVNFLFKLIVSYFKKEIKNVMENKIKISITGRLNQLPNNVKNALKKTIHMTKKNNKININLALNYGSKDELVHSMKKIVSKKINISKKSISQNLYTNELGDPDILIRTGGKKRLSNFMLWQLAYTELYFLDKLWPDFNSNDFKKIVKNFTLVKRNFGAI